MFVKKIIFISLLLLIGCKTKKAPAVILEDFDVFYDRFHSDEAFQMERIKFPLEGGSAQVDGVIPWTKNNWITMKVKIMDVDSKEYEVNYKREANLFTQSFKLKGTSFGAEYRFRRLNGKWYLVYALDTNL